MHNVTVFRAISIEISFPTDLQKYLDLPPAQSPQFPPLPIGRGIRPSPPWAEGWGRLSSAHPPLPQGFITAMPVPFDYSAFMDQLGKLCRALRAKDPANPATEEVERLSAVMHVYSMAERCGGGGVPAGESIAFQNVQKVGTWSLCRAPQRVRQQHERPPPRLAKQDNGHPFAENATFSGCKLPRKRKLSGRCMGHFSFQNACLFGIFFA